jgi:hypothetical protein
MSVGDWAAIATGIGTFLLALAAFWQLWSNRDLISMTRGEVNAATQAANAARRQAEAATQQATDTARLADAANRQMELLEQQEDTRREREFQSYLSAWAQLFEPLMDVIVRSSNEPDLWLNDAGVQVVKSDLRTLIFGRYVAATRDAKLNQTWTQLSITYFWSNAASVRLRDSNTTENQAAFKIALGRMSSCVRLANILTMTTLQGGRPEAVEDYAKLASEILGIAPDAASDSP